MRGSAPVNLRERRPGQSYDWYHTKMSPSEDPDLSATAVAPLVAPPTHDARPVSLSDTGELDARRYRDRALLGAGGMGQVRLVRDDRIGRDVAMKAMRGDSTDGERFLREARVQGQLEHPSIVPVYDLALGDDGQPFFTMKRVRGVTLEHARAKYTRRRLLSAFVSVCLAVDFAHSRGVVHRDLKPSNLMLGDFGEVYVLDWGIAKLVHDEEPAALERPARPSLPAAVTQHGLVMGTAGYMAPEQALGEGIDARADVYALGAVLFELLTGEPLHAGGTVEELGQSTIRDVGDRVRERCAASDVPPELEAICLRATALERDARFPTARAMSDDLERYLDGDRDVERRRALARERAVYAAKAVARAFEGDVAARRRATLEAGRALALDPECDDAARTLMTLMTTPPSRTPDEVVEEMQHNRLSAARVAGTAGALGFAAIAAMFPVVAWMGVREWPEVVVGLLAIAVGALLSLAAGRFPRHGRSLVIGMFLSATVLLVVVSRLFGPLFAAPTVAVGLAVAGGFHPLAPRWSSVAFATVGIALPIALDLTGAVAPAYSFQADGLLVHPALASLPRVPTFVYLVVSTLAVVFAVSAYMIAVRRSLDEAQRVVLVQSWQLRHLVPRAAEKHRA
jgi:predicted Ser/Thr protein kinase